VGTVKSVGDDTFTITTQSGATVTVNVSSSTTYRDPSVSSATLANVTVGEQVAVFGTESSDTVTATSVGIGNPSSAGMGGPGAGKGGPGGSAPGAPGAGKGGPTGSPPVAVGRVKSVGDDTFTITTGSGATVTVNVSSSTTYRDPSVSSATLANVTVGEQVAVFGTESSDTVTATSVGIGNPPAAGKGGPGAGKGPFGGTPPSTQKGASASS
jgi:preprotein translocase subunit YajC